MGRILTGIACGSVITSVIRLADRTDSDGRPDDRLNLARPTFAAQRTVALRQETGSWYYRSTIIMDEGDDSRLDRTLESVVYCSTHWTAMYQHHVYDIFATVLAAVTYHFDNLPLAQRSTVVCCVLSSSSKLRISGHPSAGP
jgi:hypothetical protein